MSKVMVGAGQVITVLPVETSYVIVTSPAIYGSNLIFPLLFATVPLTHETLSL